ncbi:MAG: DUF2251 domain-containing protein [Bacteroidota bacterium]
MRKVRILASSRLPWEQRGSDAVAGVINIIWSADWLRCALVINNYCHAVFDFAAQGGYCRNEFPPPNDIWTKGERRLTDEMVTLFFGN